MVLDTAAKKTLKQTNKKPLKTKKTQQQHRKQINTPKQNLLTKNIFTQAHGSYRKRNAANVPLCRKRSCGKDHPPNISPRSSAAAWAPSLAPGHPGALADARVGCSTASNQQPALELHSPDSVPSQDLLSSNNYHPPYKGSAY